MSDPWATLVALTMPPLGEYQPKTGVTVGYGTRSATEATVAAFWARQTRGSSGARRRERSEGMFGVCGS